MKSDSLHQKVLKIGAVISITLLSVFPTLVSAHTLVFDESIYDPQQFPLDHAECYQLLDNVGQQEGQGAVEQGVKRGLRGAAAGAIAGSVSGNSGSSAAKTGAAIGTTVGVLSGAGSKNAAKQANQQERDSLMRNCMSGRGYDALN
ncbi:glycine zipper family protein [Vibrio methylphosphonaticus]|uniref:glycine zipper family protein n=1 Tax=Vibrio methylphosphonaticus TaxID=2946866 RepID=UPI002029CF7B|nr:glycine zipper family protein [Vibrio methylphosphonaticus]MCL9773767.1 glycine zipper family protein [Vibrio methylphosphonaticus]